MNPIVYTDFFNDVRRNLPERLTIVGFILGPAQILEVTKGSHMVSLASPRTLYTGLVNTSWSTSRIELCGKPVFEVAIDSDLLRPVEEVTDPNVGIAASQKHTFACVFGLAIEDSITGFTHFVYHQSTDWEIARFGTPLSAIIGRSSPHQAPPAVDLKFKDRLAAAKFAEADTLAVLKAGNVTKRHVEPHGYPSREDENRTHGEPDGDD